MSEVEIPVPCLHVFRNISDYLEDAVDPETRAKMEAHFRECSYCINALANMVRELNPGKKKTAVRK